MLFTRSIPKRKYRNYTRYRNLLRTDFQYRCAYCLTHEFHNGGVANFAIDHHRPRHGTYAISDLANEYTNLYWACNECNQNKANQWPSPQEEAMGLRWIDPCEAWGNHDLHWKISPDGEIQWLTPEGQYTIKKLMLHRREWLKNHWRKLSKVQTKYDMLMAQREELLSLLAQKESEASERASALRTMDDLTKTLMELKAELEPPVFNRPRTDPDDVWFLP